MDREHRTFERIQCGVEAPAGEIGSEPRIDPGLQNPACLFTMVLRETAEAFRGGKLGLRFLDSLDRPIFDEGLSGYGNHRLARLGKSIAGLHSHSAANAMTAGDEVADR